MDSEILAGSRQGWRVRLTLAVLGLIGGHAIASTAPPHEYYVLSPEPLTGVLSVMSLEPNNTISFGSGQLTLKQYETATIPAAAFTSGTKFSGTGFFTVGSNEDAADLLVPDDFAGTAFVVPHIAGAHKYFFLSPSGTAQVTIRLGASTYNFTAAEGVVNEFDAGSDNGLAGRITSDVPIVITHVAYLSGGAQDAYPVPPAVNEVFGIRSQHTLLGALTDGTSITVYASDSTSASYTLDAGEQVTVTAGAGSGQGQGSALRVVANAPIAAVQYDDGDGSDATAFWTSGNFGRRHGLPIDAQYLAVACDQASVTLTLYKGANPPETQSCSGSSTTPGKAYFGSSVFGANLAAGWYLISSSPVYVMYEASSSQDEHNVLGLTPAAGPAVPVLDTISSPTSNNPQSVSGTAGANQTVRLYVNGLLQSTTTADGSGGYAFNAALTDGTNTLYTTAVTAGNESDPSNAISVDYANTLPRSQSGTISGTVVWTPGNPAQAYTVTTADLIVAAGAQLILQPGTQVRFGSGRRLTVNGTLVVNGTSASNVVFTSDLATPTRGSWVGLVIGSTATNVLIEGATIEWPQTGINVPAGVVATIRNNTIRNFSTYGISLTSSTAATLISGNLIDNLNNTATCLYLSSASPTIQGNTLRDCQFGLRLSGNSTAAVNGNNIITSNVYGIYATTQSPQPVVTGNQIYGNSTYNYYAESFTAGAQNLTLNATGNWWGTTDATTISAGILDLTDSYTSTTRPTVNYGDFLDGPNGSAVPGNYLSGPLAAAATTLIAGTTYDVLGTVFVGADKSLTVPAGTVLRFHGATTRLVIDGTLTIQGASGNLAVLTSGRTTPARGDWAGVLIRNGSTTSLVEYAQIEWAVRGVEFAVGAIGTVRHSTIRNFSDTGIYFTSSTAATLISGNLIDNLNNTATCLYLSSASPTIQGNTLRDCQFGLRLSGNSTAAVNGNNIITSNVYGIYATTQSPQPVVTGNQIYGNSTYNYYAESFTAGAQNLTLNATGNWWGTTDATTISAGILDLTDSYTSTTRPTVNYGDFLDGPNGSAVPGNYLSGPLAAAATTLIAGTTYDVLGTVFVGADKSLTVPAGTVLRFHGAATRLVVDGTLTVQGVSGNLAVLTSGRTTPARGDWAGVLIRNGSTTSLVEYAQIEWAVRGVEFAAGAIGTVRHSTIRNFSDTGIYFTSSTAATLISGNLIDNLNNTATCLYLSSASPTIQGNTLRDCQFGLRLSGNSTAAVNGNNIITSNVYGIYATTQSPQPVVTGNQIYGNSTYNYYAESFTAGAQNLTLNATGNWWGTTDATTISAGILDLTDSYTSTTRPTVNYGDFLDGPNGSAVPGNYLSGPLAAAATTLIAGTTYDVLGTVFVGADKSLTVPAGTVLRFHGAATRLVVDGTLTVQGVSGNLAVLTSGRTTPARGDWAGVLIRNGSTTSLVEYAQIEWAVRGVEFAAGAIGTVRHSTIRNFSDTGIYFTSSTAATLISGNLIDNLNNTATCLYLSSASPTIQGNTLRDCQFGLRLSGNSTAAVNGNNIITSNVYGIYATTQSPQPVVTGNQIYGNSTYNYYAESFTAGAQNLTLNATGNWWGTTDATTISAGILDLTDSYTSTTRPTVNYGDFLDGPNGSAVPGNYLSGPLAAAATTLIAGTTYDVLGTVFVGADKSLTVPAGTVLRFHGATTRLVIDGTLTIQGASGNLAVLTSGRTTPARGDWAGVLIRNGSTTSLVEYAQIEWAVRGVEFAVGAIGTVRHSTIRNFSDTGIYFTSSTAATLISGNLIDNLNNTATCLYLSSASPTIQGNTLRDCQFGLRLSGNSTAAVNGNNIITSNVYGIYATTQSPQPVVTGNQIYGNSTYNYYAESFTAGAQNLTLNATGNWWGTTDATTISAGILDLTDSYTSTTRPTVNYGDFLDGPNGSAVPGNYLIGPLAATSTTLTAGATYEVIGTVFVGAGKSLTVPAGTVLRFHTTQTRLVVDGTLTVQGTESARVQFVSGLIDPVKGAWYGIEVRASATNVLIDYAIVDWAVRAISVTGTNATISNSLIRNFSDTGIWMSGASSASQITSNYIDNFDSTGYGIYLTASSPAITGNQIHRTSVGIYAIGASNPVITGNAITHNARGIVLDGSNSNSATAVPNPTITGNDIFGNVGAQIEVYRYGASNPVVINATDNWWGTDNPQAGQQIRFTSGSPASALNYSNPATEPRTRPVSGNIVLSQLYFSPNGDAVKDVTAISGTLNQSANWTVAIRNGGYSVVRSYAGSGTSIGATWDGQDGGGQVMPDGVYAIEVTASGASGSAMVGSRTVTLDNTPPATAITSPSASAVISNVISVPVNGSAADSYLVNFTLQYGIGAAPTSWTTLNSQNTNGITNGLLGTWVVSSNNGTVGLGNGPHTLRLSTSDKAGNVGEMQIPITLDLLSITAITQSRQLMKPLAGEQLQVNFTLSAPATASVRIYPEAGGDLIKEMTQAFSTGGAKSMTWDGRTSAGAYVGDDAYSYVIYATDGTRDANYDPPAPGTIGSGSGTVDASFNANKNDFWKMNYTMNHYGRVRMQVSGCTTPTHYPYNWAPYPPGVHPLIWDGRGADGQLVSGTCNIYFDAPLYMKSNTVIVQGAKPLIIGTGASPNIEVKSNPYRITHSYEQISAITYRLDQDSYVTVKLLPPGVSDPASPAAIVLTNGVLLTAQSGGQPVDHMIEWKGYDDLDTNDILVSEEGSYTFAIQATSVISGATALYRGALQLWQ